MVDQKAIDDRLAVAVGEDRQAEDLGRVQRRRGGEADLHRVEVVEHAAVLGDVVIEAAEGELGVGQFAVEQVAAVALVDDDAVVLIDRRWRRMFSGIQHALHHALDGGDVDGGVGVGRSARPVP